MVSDAEQTEPALCVRGEHADGVHCDEESAVGVEADLGTLEDEARRMALDGRLYGHDLLRDHGQHLRARRWERREAEQ